jgi:hypothetical protein
MAWSLLLFIDSVAISSGNRRPAEGAKKGFQLMPVKSFNRRGQEIRRIPL